MDREKALQVIADHLSLVEILKKCREDAAFVQKDTPKSLGDLHLQISVLSSLRITIDLVQQFVNSFDLVVMKDQIDYDTSYLKKICEEEGLDYNDFHVPSFEEYKKKLGE